LRRIAIAIGRTLAVPVVLAGLAVLVVLAARAAPAEAQPTVPPEAGGQLQFSWDACTPIVTDKTGAQQPYTLYASVIGQSGRIMGHQIFVVIGSHTPDPSDGGSIGGVSDAWRFDVATGGCNAGQATISENPPPALAASCPPIVPSNIFRTRVTHARLAPAELGYGTNAMNVVMGVLYTNGGGGIFPNPNVRYHLASFTFDHTHSSAGATPKDQSTCGGLDCRQLLYPVPAGCTWVTPESEEFAFHIVNEGPLTFNGDNTSGCAFAVPASASTWGSIKAQYQR
jgi:hypothetical protein